MSNLYAVIERGRPALWIYGHVHDGFEYAVGATRILANPKGYGPALALGPSENASFDARMVFEV